MQAIKRALASRWAKPVLWVLGLLPLVALWAGAFAGTSANPEEALVRGAGDWAIRLLCLTLAVTPARVLLHLPQLLRLRRTLGQLTFVYACMHVALYLWLQMGLDPGEIVHDINKRPFILVGALAFALLLPLGLTSTNAAIRALGAANWQRLHRLVYVVAALAVMHFLWMRDTKYPTAEVWVYAAILAALLGWRLWYWNRQAPAAGCGHH